MRVIRACREMGIASVAVYSDVDRAALHVRKADEAYPIGPAAAAESYLNIDKILDVAKRSGAEAIHPGYGFLSENAKFAASLRRCGRQVHRPDRRFDGTRWARRPAPASRWKRPACHSFPELREAWSRHEKAKKLPNDRLSRHAEGGGRRRWKRHAPGAQPRGTRSPRWKARKARRSARSGTAKSTSRRRSSIRATSRCRCWPTNTATRVYLGERECSIQRRHQKVLEEAPSPIVDPDMRRRMGEVAVRVAKAAKYTNAGTVEFLVDQEKNFYFLEMNTRLQVEHPVTELITGLDLVHLQIRIAAGEKLPFTQEDVADPRARHRVPHLRRGSRQQLLSQSRQDYVCCSRPRARASAATAACMKAGTCRSITIRCWPS